MMECFVVNRLRLLTTVLDKLLLKVEDKWSSSKTRSCSYYAGRDTDTMRICRVLLCGRGELAPAPELR
jgi:hypothetical protein